MAVMINITGFADRASMATRSPLIAFETAMIPPATPATISSAETNSPMPGIDSRTCTAEATACMTNRNPDRVLPRPPSWAAIPATDVSSPRSCPHSCPLPSAPASWTTTGRNSVRSRASSGASAALLVKLNQADPIATASRPISCRTGTVLAKYPASLAWVSLSPVSCRNAAAAPDSESRSCCPAGAAARPTFAMPSARSRRMPHSCAPVSPARWKNAPSCPPSRRAWMNAAASAMPRSTPPASRSSSGPAAAVTLRSASAALSPELATEPITRALVVPICARSARQGPEVAISAPRSAASPRTCPVCRIAESKIGSRDRPRLMPFSSGGSSASCAVSRSPRSAGCTVPERNRAKRCPAGDSAFSAFSAALAALLVDDSAWFWSRSARATSRCASATCSAERFC